MHTWVGGGQRGEACTYTCTCRQGGSWDGGHGHLGVQGLVLDLGSRGPGSTLTKGVHCLLVRGRFRCLPSSPILGHDAAGASPPSSPSPSPPQTLPPSGCLLGPPLAPAAAATDPPVRPLAMGLPAASPPSRLSSAPTEPALCAAPRPGCPTSLVPAVAPPLPPTLPPPPDKPTGGRPERGRLLELH